MSHDVSLGCHFWQHRLRLTGLLLGFALILALPVMLRREPVRLSFVNYTQAGPGLRTAFLCLSNASPERITFLSDGGTQPYYQLIQYLTLATNPMTMLVTNYNQDAFFHVTQGSLEPHAGVVFPVAFPPGASNTTIIINYFPPEDLFREVVEKTQILLGRRAVRSTRSYQNLTLQPPVN